MTERIIMGFRKEIHTSLHHLFGTQYSHRSLARKASCKENGAVIHCSSMNGSFMSLAEEELARVDSKKEIITGSTVVHQMSPS